MSENRKSEIRVSTIIPVYNGAATIARAIDSALAQDFDGQEIIVVNDGSTDHTAAELAKYGDRICVINKPNGGAASARNAGIAIARGEFVAFLDADDIWLPGHLAPLLDALRKAPEAVLAFGDFRVIGDDGVIYADSIFSVDLCGGRPLTMDDLLTRTWPILPTATAVRTKAVRDCGGFDESFKAAAWEDFYLWLILRENGPFVSVPKVLAIHIDHPNSAPEKYRIGQERFLRLIRIRYGERAYALRQHILRDFSTKLFFRGIARIKRSDHLGGLRDLALSARYSPAEFANNLQPVSRLWRFARPIFSNHPK